jgi:hypothetical protein
MAGILDTAKESVIKGILDFYAGGEKPRAIVKGILNGDTTGFKNAYASLKQLGDPEYMSKIKPMDTQEAMDIAMFALTSGGDVSKLLSKKTQYELAHELAQKNAVEMLGLPPTNTAMDRAKALGFGDKTYYHGTNADIKAFNPEMSSQGGITWIADTPKYANDYTMNASQGAGNIIPLKAKMGKAAGWKEYDQLGLDELSGRGYQSTWLPEKNADSVGFVMNPNQLRSPNAAFDPARAHEADLLGMATPEMLGLLAAGSAGGIAYANNKKKK